MQRPSIEDERRVIWSRILEAAMRHHKRTKAWGMQAVIADDAGLGTAAVSKWKNLLSTPEDETIRHLASLYDVSTAWLSGADEAPGYGEFGTPSELLDRAANITELVIKKLMPNERAVDVLPVMRRAHELLLQGLSEREVKGVLLDEIGERDGATLDDA